MVACSLPSRIDDALPRPASLAGNPPVRHAHDRRELPRRVADLRRVPAGRRAGNFAGAKALRRPERSSTAARLLCDLRAAAAAYRHGGNLLGAMVLTLRDPPIPQPDEYAA